MKELTKHSAEISNLCKANNVFALFAFGSILNDSFKPESDVDLVVAIEGDDPLKYADYYFNLKAGLESVFNRKVDLLEERAIRNPFFRKEIEKTKVLLYAK